jgi:hypothetical protein
MTIERSRIGTTHMVAVCRGCEKMWDNYKTASAAARRHAEETGHVVNVERCQAWTYKQTR